VDWAQVHARIEHLARELAGAGVRAPEEEARLLAERARALARPGDRAGRDEARPLDVVRFTLGGRAVAVGARWVVEAVREVTPTPLPGATPPVRALVAWRGRVLTALDLRDALGAPPRAADGPGQLLVLGAERPELGLLVDEIVGLDTLDERRLHPPPDGAAGGDYAAGLADDATFLLDGAAVLRRHPTDA
jgi:purine-binding chemotaxis protein CheW